MKVCGGIDPGHMGGICIISDKDIRVYPMPVYKYKGKTKYNIREIASILKDNLVEVCYVEEPMMPFGNGKFSVASTFRFAGMMECMLTMLDIPFEFIRPQVWQKEVLGKVEKGKTKEKSIKYALKNEPHLRWKRSVRSEKISDGMTDAYCIARYGVMRIK